MADAKRCDRCGGFYIKSEKFKDKYELRFMKNGSLQLIDLYGGCMDKLEEFMEEVETDVNV